RLRSRCHPLGDHPLRGAPGRPGRHRGRGDPGARSGARRDDRRAPAHRPDPVGRQVDLRLWLLDGERHRQRVRPVAGAPAPSGARRHRPRVVRRHRAHERRCPAPRRKGENVKGLSARRKATDRLMLALMAVAVLLALVPLASILLEVVLKGAGAIHGLSFFTKPPPGDATATGGGLANAIVGTLIMVAMATVVFVPLGILGAVYLSEFASNNRLARAVRFFSEVMTGIPSIMVGIFAYGLIVVYT